MNVSASHVAPPLSSLHTRPKMSMRVTFCCRLPDSLRSENTAGCGAVAGIIHFNRMREESSAKPHHPYHLDTSCCAASPFREGQHDSSTPVLVCHEDHVAAEVSDAVDDDFELHRRQHLSHESSWVITSPPRSSCSTATTPGGVRTNASCGTDLCDNDDALDDSDDDEHAAAVSLAEGGALMRRQLYDELVPPLPRHAQPDWDLLTPTAAAPPSTAHL